MGYEVDFFPVGDGERSGDAIAIRLGNLRGPRREQTVVVIDGGFTDSGEAVVNHVKTCYNTNYIDLAISTHPDADHAGGLAVVLEQLGDGALWLHQPWNHTVGSAPLFKNGRVTDEGVERSLRESLNNAVDLERLAVRRGIPIFEPFAGLTDASGNVVVIGPTKEYYESLLPTFRGTPEPMFPSLASLLGRGFGAVTEAVRFIAERWNAETLTDDGETSAENNSSAIVLVRGAADRCMLFTGDAGIPALTHAADLLQATGFNFDHIRFVQLPHHGSQHNVGPTILNRLIGPKLATNAVIKTAFVSAAPDGAPKHPSKKVTNAFLRRGAPVHATQGVLKTHYLDSPRTFGSPSIPLPFYNQVED